MNTSSSRPPTSPGSRAAPRSSPQSPGASAADALSFVGAPRACVLEPALVAVGDSVAPADRGERARAGATAPATGARPVASVSIAVRPFTEVLDAVLVGCAWPDVPRRAGKAALGAIERHAGPRKEAAAGAGTVAIGATGRRPWIPQRRRRPAAARTFRSAHLHTDGEGGASILVGSSVASASGGIAATAARRAEADPHSATTSTFEIANLSWFAVDAGGAALRDSRIPYACSCDRRIETLSAREAARLAVRAFATGAHDRMRAGIASHVATSHVAARHIAVSRGRQKRVHCTSGIPHGVALRATRDEYEQEQQ